MSHHGLASRLEPMRWHATICALCALLCAVTARAQQPPAPFAPSKVNAERLRWLEYRMVAGRVTATSAYPEGMNVSFGPSLIRGRLREYLQLWILKDRASVRYDLAGDGQRLSIVLDQNGDFSLHRARGEGGFEIRFLQPDGGRLSLAVIEQNAERSVQGDSFWHLYLAEPELVRRHLIPDLELLRASWQLAATGWAIEEALVERATHPRPLDTKLWARLVDELASPQFAKRQSAQRQLFQIGQVILPYLERLDRSRLDAEQASRVDMLVDALAVNYEDNADRIATWLAADERIWLSLLSRREAAKRRVAARQLEVLAGHPIEFDPDGAAETRQRQLDALKSLYARARPGSARRDGENAPSIPPPGVER
jgi:hypothetical protein